MTEPTTPPEFTAEHALVWLGIDREVYLESERILAGRHGNPLGSAVLAARDAQGTDTTAAEILARLGIDPGDPLAAVRRFDRQRARYDT